MPDFPQTQRERRGHDFYPPANQNILALYATEHVPTADKIVHLHYFVGACNWWIVEYDPAEGIAFGYACLGDPELAEWGYVSLPELEAVTAGPLQQPAERDLNWQPKPVRELNLPGRNALL